MLTTADYLIAVIVYVAFRSSHPDKAIMAEVAKKLLENKHDITHLFISTTNHCQ